MYAAAYLLYDAFNQLASYSDGGTTAQYIYRADELRSGKTVNTVRTDFVWNGQNLASETVTGTRILFGEL